MESANPLLVAAFQTDTRANGGLESLTAVLERLEGYRVVILTERESAFNARWRRAGFDVYVWAGAAPRASEAAVLRRAKSLAHTLRWSARLPGLVRELGCRIVHCNDILALLHVAPAARLLGLKVVFTIRGTTNVRGTRWRLARALSQRVVALSEEMGNYLECALPNFSLLRAGDIQTIYSIVDFGRMFPLSPAARAEQRAALGIASGEVAIGIVGAFVPLKQQLETLRFLAAAPRALPEAARLYFIGDYDPARSEYSRACQGLLEHPALAARVRAVGYTEGVAAWYQALDQLVVPSRHEGLSRAMIEALASGVPVVSFDVCSAREVLLGNGCGFVAPQGDFQALFAACRTLDADSALREDMRVAAVAAARRYFSAESAVGAWRELYRQLEQEH